MNIRSQFSKGVYKKDIARELGVSPKTISRVLKRNGVPKNKRNMAKYSKLDSFKSFIDKMLSENIWNSIVSFRELQDKGYNGGITILRDYIQPKRVMRKSKVTVRFETEPGQQMQSYWGKIKVNISGKLKTFGSSGQCNTLYNFSIGVSKFNVFLGRPFSSKETLSNLL